MWNNLQEAYDAFQALVSDLTGGVNDMLQAAQGAGVFRIPDMVAGTGNPRDSDDSFTGTPDLFTGIALLFPAMTIGGITYHIVIMKDGVLGVGANNIGQLLAGGGAVALDFLGETIRSDGSAFEVWSSTLKSKFSIQGRQSNGMIIGMTENMTALTVTNGDFESSLATGWTVVEGAQAISTLYSHSGTHSINGDGSIISSSFITLSTDGFYVEWWSYGASTSENASVFVKCYDVSSAELGALTSIGQQFVEYGVWRKHFFVGNVPTGTTKIKLQVTTSAASYLDDIALYSAVGAALFGTSATGAVVPGFQFFNTPVRLHGQRANFTADGSITGSNLSGTNTGDETGARLATLHHAASAKSALVDADEVTGGDSAASFGLIRSTWTNVKAFLKTYFDTLYPSGSGTHSGASSGTNTGDVTLTGAPNYLTIAAQVITRALIDLTAHVTGVLPVANGGTGVGAPTGTYTPTLTNVTNIAASTASTVSWYRIDNMVHCFGNVDIDPTAAGAIELGISLPVASALTGLPQVSGMAVSIANVSPLVASINADATNDRAKLVFTAVTGNLANATWAFEFSYRIL